MHQIHAPFVVDYLLVGEGIDTVIGQGGCHHPKLFRVHTCCLEEPEGKEGKEAQKRCRRE